MVVFKFDSSFPLKKERKKRLCYQSGDNFGVKTIYLWKTKTKRTVSLIGKETDNADIVRGW